MLVRLTSVRRSARLGLLVLCGLLALDGCRRRGEEPAPWVGALTTSYANGLRLGMTVADLPQNLPARLDEPYGSRVFARVSFKQPGPFIGAILSFDLESDSIRGSDPISDIRLYSDTVSASEIGRAVEARLMQLAGDPAEIGCSGVAIGKLARTVTWTDPGGTVVRLYIPVAMPRNRNGRTRLQISAADSPLRQPSDYRTGPCS